MASHPRVGEPAERTGRDPAVVDLFTLTDAEWATVVQALRVAAERYNDHAQLIAASCSISDTGRRDLVDQFVRQADRARALATRIEEGAGV